MTTDTEVGAISVRVGADIGDLNASLDQAARALQSTTDGMQSDLGLVSDRASRVFDGLAGAVARSATSGRSSVHGMVDGILAELSRIAIKTFITKPLDGLFDQILGGAMSFGGACATGGPVAPGSAYLVGEQGPEIFQPSQSGTIIPNGRLGGGITVNIYAQDAPSVIRSEAQVTAMLARAAARGQRNL